MCLAVKPKAKIKIASEDKICYKVYNKFSKYKKKHLISPYQLTSYPYESLPIDIKSYIQPTTIIESSSHEVVNIGLHSFKDLNDAIAEAKKWNNRFKYTPSSMHFTVFKCIIPKETRYWSGTFNHFGKPSYCSERLIIQEEIPT